MALYSVLLEPDNKGLLKLLNYVSSESIINNKIRPSINIGAFICERESVILDFYSGLAHILEPFFLNFINIDGFDNGTVYLSGSRISPWALSLVMKMRSNCVIA